MPELDDSANYIARPSSFEDDEWERQAMDAEMVNFPANSMATGRAHRIHKTG